jgi:membrane protein
LLYGPSRRSLTLTAAFNAAYEVPETRRRWKVLLLSLAFGPVLALIVIVSVGLMLIGPQVVEQVAQLVGWDRPFVLLWGWLRFPVALFLLAVVLSVVYRYGPDTRQRFRSVDPGVALAVVLWAVSSVGFSFYLANFAMLFYLYLCASVVLVGAGVNAAIYHVASDSTIQSEKPGSGHETAGVQRLKDV